MPLALTRHMTSVLDLKRFLPFRTYLWTWWFLACDYDHQFHAVMEFICSYNWSTRSRDFVVLSLY